MNYYIYCDGGVLNNQEPTKRSGYGSFYVTTTKYPDHEKGKIASQKLLYGNVTNNVAEYKTLLGVLEFCVQQFIARATIFTDSNLVVSQLNGNYRTKDIDLKPLKEQAQKDIELIDAKIEKVPRDIIVGVLGH